MSGKRQWSPTQIVAASPGVKVSPGSDIKLLTQEQGRARRRVRMSEVADQIADAVGMKFDKMTGAVHGTPRVVGPLGLAIPLKMKFSHGTQQTSYLAICWKVIESLYVAVCAEPLGVGMTTVLLLDKKRYCGKHFDRSNLSLVAQAADGKNLIETVPDYVKLWHDGVIGVWSRAGSEGAWHRWPEYGGEPGSNLERGQG